ncbi:MAG: DNA polymerase III subunit alpha [Caldilineaceae bacterium]
MSDTPVTAPFFTHLHVHSHFSLLSGTAPLDALVERAIADQFTHLALTDTNALYGAVEFAQSCRTHDIQPITGMTLNVAPPEITVQSGRDGPGQLVLLATDPTGYRSLCRLSSAIQGSSDREEIARRGLAWDALAAHHAGLICITGGLRDWAARFLQMDARAAAARWVSRLSGLFDERCWLGLDLHTPQDADLATELIALGERFGVPAVAAQPVYCLSPQDRPTLRLLAAINENCRLADVPAHLLPDQGQAERTVHWLSPAEMQQRFAAFPAALDATSQITAQCQPALPDGRPIWPVLKLPPDTTPDQALRELAEDGLQTQYGASPPDLPLEGEELRSPNIRAETQEQNARQRDHGPLPSEGRAGEGLRGPRLHHELAIIAQHGYAPLFLIVADLIAFAREQQIPVSTRGSVANSLVAYCIGITTVDPIAHELLFERFLNPERTDPPDIDLDFCSIRRDEVLKYVRRTYKKEQVALVATISTMRPKSAVRETGKAHGLNEDEIKRLIGLLPDTWHPDPRRRVRSNLDEILAKIAEAPLRAVVRDAYAILGQPHHLSIHPGGLVITPGPLTDYAPVQWTPKGFLATQYDYGSAEAIGLLKIDLLGIRALTVLDRAGALVRQHFDANFRVDAIPLDDAATGAALAAGDTCGVFQCESSGAQRTLRQLRAHSVADLAAANAFFKPGPATGGMAAAFVRRYRGEEQAAYLHPALEPILRSTQGVLLYQEQILRVAREIAGLSWAEADHLRRGMSKFRAHEMETMRTRFVEGCMRPAPDGPEFEQNQAETLWEQIKAFAGYGFNQGHATAYADVSYRSAYIKEHWPAAFLAARLANYGGFHHPAIYMAEATRLNIAVRPPHINQSDRHFTLHFEGESAPVLWMGLGQVKSLRRNAAQSIIAERNKEPFTALRDLLGRVELQQKEIVHLIQCGALDGLAANRATLLAEANDLQGRGGHSAQQMTFAFIEYSAPDETPAQRLAWEQRILGQPVSVHPLVLLNLDGEKLSSLKEAQSQEGRQCRIAATRLPGWTGGKGFFISDGQSFAIAQGHTQMARPRAWEPLLLTGRWRLDEWGSGWFQVEQLAKTERKKE